LTISGKSFDNVVHSAESWTTKRRVMPLYLNKGIYDHFKEHH